jgi:hypothetical protein
MSRRDETNDATSLGGHHADNLASFYCHIARHVHGLRTKWRLREILPREEVRANSADLDEFLHAEMCAELRNDQAEENKQVGSLLP